MRPTVRRRPASSAALRAIAGAAAAVLALSSCSLLDDGGDGGSDGGSSVSAPSASASGGSGASGDTPPLAEIVPAGSDGITVDTASDPAYAAYYEQRIQWGPCAEDVTAQASMDVECGTITVPKIWNDPAAGDIEIAVDRVAASGTKQGSLVVNPGGPGGSGVDFVAQNADYVFSPEMLGAFDIVGFDPRGVSRSAGIQCLDDAETDEYLADTYDMSTPEGFDQAMGWMQRISDACAANSADLLPYLDTYSAARDMDVLRSALDSEKLDYLGFSYGTYLGASYAEVYPERVGRFVLDGALDPSITGDELSAGQAAGFQHALEQFTAFCLEQEGCPLRGPSTEEGLEQLSALLESIAQQPLQTSDPDRPLTGALASSGLALLMYSDESWPIGVTALQQAANGDGSLLLMFADLGSERSEDGTYSGNSLFAITAVNCLDHPGVASREWQEQETARLLEEYPDAGFTAYGQTMCDLWPAQAVREPAEIHASGSDLIVVIGTTGDPATPYVWAEGLAAQLENSVLLTFEGNGHTAYGRSGGCIESAVDAYFLEGTPPQDGLTC